MSRVHTTQTETARGVVKMQDAFGFADASPSDRLPNADGTMCPAKFAALLCKHHGKEQTLFQHSPNLRTYSVSRLECTDHDYS
jgi:hypothetical protein